MKHNEMIARLTALSITMPPPDVGQQIYIVTETERRKTGSLDLHEATVIGYQEWKKLVTADVNERLIEGCTGIPDAEGQEASITADYFFAKTLGHQPMVRHFPTSGSNRWQHGFCLPVPHDEEAQRLVIDVNHKINYP